MQSMPGKAQVPELDTSGGGACQMPGPLLDQGRMGDSFADTCAAVAITLMTEAPARIQSKAAQAGGREAAPDEALEHSGPDLAAQQAKQARRQAKRARQRARRAQVAAAGTEIQVCSRL